MQQKMKKSLAVELNEVSKQIIPYCCAIQIKSGEIVKTLGHIPREISWHCSFFLKEGREINGNVLSTTYQPSPNFLQTLWRSLWIYNFKVRIT